MSKCIVVLGVHRSGSSCLAGILYHLGVNMGDNLLATSISNPRGHFEDRDFLEISIQAIGDWRSPTKNISDMYIERYEKLIREKEKKYEIWGIKDPRLCYLLKYFYQKINHLKIISIDRNLEHCASSLAQREKINIEVAEKITLNYLAEKNYFLEIITGKVPRMSLPYNKIIANPISTITEIIDFIGLEKNETRIRNAFCFIDPILNHYREIELTI